MSSVSHTEACCLRALTPAHCSLAWGTSVVSHTYKSIQPYILHSLDSRSMESHRRLMKEARLEGGKTNNVSGSLLLVLFEDTLPT